MSHREYLLENENRGRGAKIEGDIKNIIYTYSGGDASDTLVPKALHGLIIEPLPEGISFEGWREYFSMETYKDFIEFATSVSLRISYGVPIYVTQEERWEEEEEHKEQLVFKGLIEYNDEKIATFGDYSQPREGMEYKEWRNMPFSEYTLTWINLTIWEWVVKSSVFLKLVYKNGEEHNLRDFRGEN